MKRILCSLLVATLPFGSALADAPKSAKVTLVYQHELPNKAGQAPRGVRGGHEGDGTDDSIRELRS